MQMRTFIIAASLALTAAIFGCNPAEGLCQKQFDCHEQLGLNLEDDYVEVCAAELEGQNNALRKNAEKECKDLADAQVALATCLSTLSCDDLKKAQDGGDTLCKDVQKDFSDKNTAADNGAKCDGIDDDAGEGEGEGAGEGEGEGAGQ
jgi:hypothetical protein